MREGIAQVCTFLLQLAGFILGGVAGLFLGIFVVWLALGAPKGPDSGGPMFAPLLFAGPVGFFTGGFVGMRLAGKWAKAVSRHDAEPGNGGPAAATKRPP